MGLSCPHTCWKCFRILDPPPLHPPPSSLVIHWLCTSWPLSPYNFTNLGLCLENFLKNCFSPCPGLSWQLCALVSGIGNPPWTGGQGASGPPGTHRCSRSAQEPGAPADARSREKRPGGSRPCASDGTRWLRSVHSPQGRGIAAGI